jgi:hypothetical protein
MISGVAGNCFMDRLFIVFGQKAGYFPISALKKLDTPKFKALSNKKGLKSRTIRILGGTFLNKAGLSRKVCR